MQDQELNTIARNLLQALQLGTVRRHAGMAVFPLFPEQTASIPYTTLAEAMAAATLTVAEVDEGGSVPELAVVNTGGLPVLLLDGEELAGAKQNRVLNTTILLKKQSKTIIPVSCTEQGRWAYASPAFEDSGVIMHRSARLRKSRSVSSSLAQCDAYASDQGEVWEDINELRQAAGTSSATGAMRDVFTQREEAMEAYLKVFKAFPGQCGLFVFVNGAPVGFDYVSAPAAYAVLQPKLIRSYAMDAMLAGKLETTASGKSSNTQLIDSAKAMLAKAAAGREHRHKSIGHGWDHRFDGDNLVGSALQYRDQVVHMAFFADDGQAPQNPRSTMMADACRRRAYRTAD